MKMGIRTVRNAWRTDTQKAAKTGKVCRAKGFGEDVGDVVRRTNAEDLHLVKVNEVTNGVISDADSEMFNFRMPTLILRELACSAVVTVERSGVEDRSVKAIKEPPKEEEFMRRVVDGDVLGVARGISGVLLFV
jgi:hypothetical protein